MIKIDQLHSDDAPAAIYQQLSARAQDFIVNIDFRQLSKSFQ